MPTPSRPRVTHCAHCKHPIPAKRPGGRRLGILRWSCGAPACDAETRAAGAVLLARSLAGPLTPG